jgi:uncharacterized cupredoxin-like copper-binding protein
VFRSRSLIALVAPLALVSVSCSKEQPAPEPVAIPSVMVMASDYAFQMPDTLSAGVTSFRLMNHGKEMHHLTLIRLAEGMTVADLAKMQPNAPLPAGLTFEGGPNYSAPGGAIEAVVDLKPGNYAAVCAIPSPDGVMHMAKGMVHPFVVTAASDTAKSMATAPDADIVIKLADYSFTPSTPLNAGRHVIRVENDGTQWHEMVFVKLEPGKTLEDLARYAEKPDGPPPGSPIDGVAPLSPGESNTITVNLTPGEYGFICFLPDTKDGKPHLMHGMIQQISVR